MNTFEVRTDTGNIFQVEAKDIYLALEIAHSIVKDTSTYDSGVVVSIYMI